MQVVLTQLEVTGIQDYIFASNNLKQNIGASELVSRCATQWVVDALRECNFACNGAWDARNGTDIELNQRRITDPDIVAEIIYAGGGNALILFKGDDPRISAREFTERLTFRALAEARGLSMVVAHSPAFDWRQESLSKAHIDLRQQVARRKLSSVASLPQPGLGVTAACSFTGLPATGVDEEERLISTVARHKIGAAANADARLANVLPQVERNGYEFVHDFDLFGERGESSHIAIMHADGNRMGERFDAIAKAHPAAGDNGAYALQLRQLSEAVKTASAKALQSTVDLLIGSLDAAGDRFGGEAPVPSRRQNGRRRRYLPFRPVVFGGDDVTFVSEGRLGLSLASHFLRSLLETPLPGARSGETGDPLYSRAGVAIVKSHYPFSRAYELAEDLGRSAKKRLNEWGIKGSVLDWHISTSGAVLALDEIRRREYTAATGNSLLMRPLLVERDRTEPERSAFWRSWETFAAVFDEFKEKWGDKRNKVKALRDALRQGPTGVEAFRENYEQEELPAIKGLSNEAQSKGWAGAECGYYDVVEALDFHVPLDKRKEGRKHDS